MSIERFDEMHQCLECQSKFSVQFDNFHQRLKDLFCPVCGSTTLNRILGPMRCVEIKPCKDKVETVDDLSDCC
jgi:rRNA maturation endonuclease Nob1